MDELMSYDEAVKLAGAKNAEDKSIPLFFYEAVRNEAKSQEAGRAIFDNVAMVKIFIPGDRSEYVFRASAKYQERYPKAWRDFTKRQKASEVEGTKLQLWPLLDVSQVAELNSLHVFTVEQLAELNDEVVSRLGARWHTLRDNAKLFLKSLPALAAQVNTTENEELVRLKRELENKEAEIEALEIKLDRAQEDVRVYREQCKRERASRSASVREVKRRARKGEYSNEPKDGAAELRGGSGDQEAG